MNMWYIALLGYASVAGLAFILFFGPPWHTNSPRMAWLQAGIALSSFGIDALLVLVLLRIIPPPWAILGVLLFKDIVFTWRLVTLLALHRKERRDSHDQSSGG